MKPKLIRNLWAFFSKNYPKLACEINFVRHYKNYEPDLWLIPAFSNKNTNVIDVGVNMGIFSRWMAKHAKHVHAFECNPNLFSNLEGFLPANVSLHKFALSSSKGKQTLRFDPENTGIGTIENSNNLDKNPGIKTITSVEVEVRRIDDFVLGEVTFIKIDVEGHELEVLKGAKQLLSTYKPVLLIEICEDHCPGNLQAVPQWLAQFGYNPYILNDDEKLVPVNELIEHSKSHFNFWFKTN